MATEGGVKLIGIWASPFVVRARIALHLKEIEYQFLQEEFGKKSDLLLKSNPVHKKIPVLIHEGKPICESLIIVQYIDEVWPASGPPILPADAYERAVARFWAAFVDDKLPTTTRVFLWDADEKKKEEAKEQIFATLLQLEEAFVECSKGKSFFGGDTIGFVDIALGSYLGWLKAMETITGITFFDKEKIPNLVGWAESLLSTAVAKEVIPEAEKLVEFSKLMQSVRSAAPPPPTN